MRRSRRELEVLSDSTQPRLLRTRAAEHPDRAVFHVRDENGEWVGSPWSAYAKHSREVALGLETLGVGANDRVVIHAASDPLWVWTDLGVQTLRGIMIGVYPTSPVAELSYLLQDSGAKTLFVDAEQLDKAIEAAPSCPSLEHIVLIGPGDPPDDAPVPVVRMVALMERGAHRATEEPDRFDELVDATSSDDPCCIVYTSGTTGPPKGVVLNQRNCLAAAWGFIDGLGFEADDSVVSYLPLNHVAARTFVWLSLELPIQVYFSTVVTVRRDLAEIEPTYFGVVPRIAQKMIAEVEVERFGASRLRRLRYHTGLALGRWVARRRIRGAGRLGRAERAALWVADRLSLDEVRIQLGLSRASKGIIGAVAPPPEIVEFFHVLGVRLVQIYGQTEYSGTITMHHGWDVKYDSVGTPVGDTEVLLDEVTGEILARGLSVFQEYWNDPDATAATIEEGWLHTGDVGRFDDNAHLYIVGRIKDIIITAGGKNVSPAIIENPLKRSACISEVIVVGEGRPYLVGLVACDPEAIAGWARVEGISDTSYSSLIRRPELRALVQGLVDECNRDLNHVEQIKRFAFFPEPLSHERDELTATQKARRSVIEKRYAGLVEELYAVPG